MAFCSKCGSELAEEGAFCASCGTKVDGQPQAYAPQKNHIEIFVGKNFDYFKRKWEIAERNRGKKARP
jgi:uncharacterized membrane protein YvbJ